MQIRQADQNDQEQLINLIMVIIDEMQAELYLKLGFKQTKALILEAAKKDPQSRYNYRRAIVAQIDGKLAGCVFGYPSIDEPKIDLTLNKLTKEKYPSEQVFFPDSEVVGNEWYLDSIVVKQDQRGKGIGSKLLDYLPKIVRKANQNIIGLNVDDNNPMAKKLYLRQGFKEIKKITIGPHKYTHMYYYLEDENE